MSFRSSVDATVIELTESGGCIWRWIDGSKTVAEISELLSGEYAIEPAEALMDVQTFLASLEDMGIISYLSMLETFMGHRRVNDHPEYVGSFRNWETRSGVRSKPRREMLDHCDDAIFFPPELVPVLAHPRIRDRADIRDEILIHSLYQYMYFTAVVEQLAVLPVAARISLGRLDVQVPPQMRRDAFKICTDEAWHAQCSDDFTEQVARVTGIDPCARAEPQFVPEVGRIRAQLDPALHDLLDIFFAIVTETLISRLLAEIPRDRRLAPPVREIVADHAEDEGRHHAYFRSVLTLIWPQLTDRQQQVIGAQVPALIRSFLQPDMAATAGLLTAVGFGGGEATQIARDACGAGAEPHGFAVSARATIGAFRDVGAFTRPGVQEAFAVANLI